MIAGTYPGLIIMAAQRHASFLHKASLAVQDGASPSSVLEGGYPRLHFSRKSAGESALQNLPPARLAAIIEQLGTAALESRKQANLAAAIAQRALLAIAVNARRRG
jgi:DNA polymerase-3 subunit delta